MGIPRNEFSYLNRSITGPDGTSYEFVADVGYGLRGWAILWGKGKPTRDTIIYVFAGEEQVRQEPAADLSDAKRIIARFEQEIRSGTF